MSTFSIVTVDQEKLDKLAELYRSGKTLEECGEAFGVSCGTAYYWLKKARVKIRRKGPPSSVEMTPELISEILSLYDGGSTLIEIYRDTGLYPKATSEILREHGRKLTRGIRNNECIRGSESAKCSALIEKRYPGITGLMGKEESLRSIGDKYGISRERVRQFEVLLGLDRRQVRRAETSKLRKELKVLERKNRKLSKNRHWISRASKFSEMALRMAPKEEILQEFRDVNPGSKLPIGLRVSLIRQRLQDESGLELPRLYHYRPSSLHAPHPVGSNQGA